MHIQPDWNFCNRPSQRVPPPGKNTIFKGAELSHPKALSSCGYIGLLNLAPMMFRGVSLSGDLHDYVTANGRCPFPNQSVHGKYNLISGSFNKISKILREDFEIISLCVVPEWQN